jgi:CHAT domain-containing protein
MALAPDRDDSGVLYLRDIQSLSLRQRPLVVLAGCQTASFGGGRGTLRSLANAFLAAGSRAVLATLWNVDDERASALTTRFYRALRAGATFPEALREAQINAIGSVRVVEWSAFQLQLGPDAKNPTQSVIH